MTRGTLCAKNSFLTYFDLGLTLGLCLSIYLKQPTVSLSDDSPKRPYLTSPALKKNISLIHKNLTLLKNLSSCIRKLAHPLTSAQNIPNLSKFLKGLLTIH
jgi:hypothetical protein